MFKNEALPGKEVRVAEGSGMRSGRYGTIVDYKVRNDYLYALDKSGDSYSLKLVREFGWVVVKLDNNQIDCFPASRLQGV